MTERRFFGLLCAHQWEIYGSSTVLRASNDECIGHLFVLRCKHCGDIKTRDLRA